MIQLLHVVVSAAVLCAYNEQPMTELFDAKVNSPVYYVRGLVYEFESRRSRIGTNSVRYGSNQ